MLWSRQVYNRGPMLSVYRTEIDEYEPSDEFLNIVRRIMPRSWRVSDHDLWWVAVPPRLTLRIQGWKIHVSTVLANAETTLEIAGKVCRNYDCSFEFVKDRRLLCFINSKSCDRGSSGRFITIFPNSDVEFKAILEDLYVELGGFDGPYILSGRRYRESKVLFYEYGNFGRLTKLRLDGFRMPVVVSPAGEIIPDEPKPWFDPPPWTEDPFPETNLSEEEEDIGTLGKGRYVISGVISQSNVGGIYKALDLETGEDVLIKEARPHTGYDLQGNDIIALRQKEWEILNLLSDFNVAPRPIDLFWDWEHLFLVEEFVPGLPVEAYPGFFSPLGKADSSLEEWSRYFAAVSAMGSQLASVIQVIHSKGIALRELSLTDVVIDPLSTRVKVVNFENASLIGDMNSHVEQSPHKMMQLDSTVVPPEMDYYVLGRILFWMLCPTHHVLNFDKNKAQLFLTEMEKDYGLPRSLSRIVTQLLDPSKNGIEPRAIVKELEVVSSSGVSNSVQSGWEREHLSDSELADAIEGIAKQLHKELLRYSGDPAYISTMRSPNRSSIAHGIAGLAYSFKELTGDCTNKFVEVILRDSLTRDAYPPGLYPGLSGISWVLALLGRVEEAQQVLREAWEHEMVFDAPFLYDGVSGLGLTSLFFWRYLNESRYLEWAVEIGNYLVDSVNESDAGCFWRGPGKLEFGYAHGSTGIAMFLLYLYLSTKESRFLDVGARALAFDLNNAVPVYPGEGISFAADEESKNERVYPYWRYGSAGVGQVLLRYLKLLGTEELSHRLALQIPFTLEKLLDSIIIDATRKYADSPGLFSGLAGVGNFLLDCDQFLQSNQYVKQARAVARGLLLFQVPSEHGGIAFISESEKRPCVDFASGSAGIGLFLNRLRRGGDNFNFMLDYLIAEQDILRRNRA